LKGDSELLTPNSELLGHLMDLPVPVKYSLDEILSQLALTGPNGPPVLPRKVLFWGEGAGEISSYITGWMAGRGIDVVVLDGANRFDPYVVSSFAKKALIPPEGLLKRIRIARAFTCYQMATLVEEKLIALLRQEEAISQTHKPWVILLGPITTFLDEDVPERETRPLFERMLRKMEEMAMDRVSFFLFQPNPPFTEVGMSRNDCRTDTRNRGGAGGFVNSKRAFLERRLFQISTAAWRIQWEEEGARLVPEKSIDSVIPVKTGIQAKRHGFLLPQE
jgi:hypothetical protein